MQKINSWLNIWWLAIRPRTLPAAASSVLMGWALAWQAGYFDLLPALAALACALLLQVGSNLANDVYDHERGADVVRYGPVRVTQAGYLTPRQVKAGMLVVLGLAAIFGLLLANHAGWHLLWVGAAAILAAVAYTGGPYPLGYHGLGDVFVFIFFGLAAVTGTYYVQAGNLPTLVWWMSIPSGLLITNILVVNNLRDIETDRAAGKRTLAVRLGAGFTRAQYIALMCLAYLIPIGLVLMGQLEPGGLLALATVPLAWQASGRLLSVTGAGLNPVLGQTGLVSLLYSLSFWAGLALF